MCGILGSINTSFNKSTLDLIAHRGPDSFGIKEFILSGNEIRFAHRRLSIVDLTESGSQPMTSTCGKYEIIFNGEIYNHKELRKELSGIQFKGTSDTETIINYFAKYGPGSIAKFNGIFSLAILDKNKNKIYLARDPFGVKPLYIHKDHSKCIFSSEIKPILRHLDSTKLNNDVLLETLKLRFSPAPGTLLDGIEKVIPGTILEIDFSKEKLQIQTKKFTAKIPGTKNLPFDQALLEYENRFEGAIKRQMMSDVEVGVLLSGGVDSALVTYYAQKYSSNKLKTFTIGFEGNNYANEIKQAEETSRLLNTDHYSKTIGFTNFLETLDEAIKIIEEPLATTSSIPMYYLSKLVKEHEVKVVLTGQGADEPLGGYRRYQLELIKNILPPMFQRVASKIFSESRNETIRRGSRSININDATERLINGYTLFDDDQIFRLTGKKEILTKKHIEETMGFLEFERNKTDLEKQLGLDLRFNLSDDLLLYTDKITMNFSIETRVPILDLELIQFIESLPLEYKVKLNQGKFIHKKFAEKILPKSIVHRKKKGFLSPTNEWFKNHDVAIMEILASNSQFCNYFDIKEVTKIIEKHKRGYNYEKQIFLLLGMNYWLKNFLN